MLVPGRHGQLTHDSFPARWTQREEPTRPDYCEQPPRPRSTSDRANAPAEPPPCGTQPANIRLTAPSTDTRPQPCRERRGAAEQPARRRLTMPSLTESTYISVVAFSGHYEDLRGLRQHGDRYFAVRVLVATQAEESQALAGFESVVSRGCA